MLIDLKPKFYCDIIACTSEVIAYPMPRQTTVKENEGLYHLPNGWEAYNKYNTEGKLVPYHICSRHEIFKRR